MQHRKITSILIGGGSAVIMITLIAVAILSRLQSKSSQLNNTYDSSPTSETSSQNSSKEIVTSHPLDDDLNDLNKKLNGLDQDINNGDQSINDKQGDLSE